MADSADKSPGRPTNLGFGRGGDENDFVKSIRGLTINVLVLSAVEVANYRLREC